MHFIPSTMNIFVACFFTWAFTYQGLVRADLPDDNLLKNAAAPAVHVSLLDLPQENAEQNYGNIGKSEEPSITLNEESSSSAWSKSAASSSSSSDVKEESRSEKKVSLAGALGEALTDVKELAEKEVSVEKSEHSEVENLESKSEAKSETILKQLPEDESKKQVVTETYVIEEPVKSESWSWSSSKTSQEESRKDSYSEEVRVLKEEKQRMEEQMRTEAEARAKAEAEAARVQRILQSQLQAIEQAEARARAESAARVKAEERALAEKEGRSKLRTFILTMLQKRSTEVKRDEKLEELKEKARISVEASAASSAAAVQAARAIRAAAIARARAASKAMSAQRAALNELNAAMAAKGGADTLLLVLEEVIIASRTAASLQAETLAIVQDAVKTAAAEGAAIDYVKYRLAISKNVAARAKAAAVVAARASVATTAAVDRLDRLQRKSKSEAMDADEAQHAAAAEAETAFAEINDAVRDETASVAKLDADTANLEASAAAEASPVQGTADGVVVGLAAIADGSSGAQAHALSEAVQGVVQDKGGESVADSGKYDDLLRGSW